MKSGIYQLTFSNKMRYIGKSVDIERRWTEHKYSFEQGKAASKMQHEYNRCGLPSAEVLLQCHRDHIDIMEAYLIAVHRPELNTTVEMPISDDDYRELMRQSQLLEESTVEHIKLISDLADKINSLEDEAESQQEYITELEKDVELEKLSVEAYASYKSEKEAHIETEYTYKLLVQELTQQLQFERSKSWWKKLLGL